MSKEQFALAKLIAKYLQKTLSVEEETALSNWAKEDEHVAALLQQYKESEILAEDIAVIESIHKESDWDQVMRKFAAVTTERKSISWLRQKWLRVAAILLLFCGVAWWQIKTNQSERIVPDHRFGYHNDVLPASKKATLTFSNGKMVMLRSDSLHFQNDKTWLGDKVISPTEYENQKIALSLNQIHVPKGGTFQMTLPDGTDVWLNAETTLAFPQKFKETERTVRLIAGEAYFEVAPKKQSPFFVELGNMRVEALGTAFNINVQSDKRIKAILTAGRISVQNGQEQKTIEPGYAVCLMEGKLVVQQADVEEALSWKEGYFYFKGKNLNEILEEVARWYDVDVEYQSDITKKRYEGGIKRDVTLGNVCKMLSDLSGHQFVIDGRKLIVT